MKTITIGEILTGRELDAMRKVFQEDRKGFHVKCAALIRAKIERINKATGQENDANYLAYAVEHALTKWEK